jgi:hypothetical protein
MQAFLEYVVKGLVQHPEAVSITPVEREGTTIYELRLDPWTWQDHRPAGHDHQRDSVAAFGRERPERAAVHAGNR